MGWAAGSAAGATGQVSGTPGLLTPEEIVVTGSRLPGSVLATDSNVAILDSEQIEDRHASSAVELLRAIPGVVIEQAGGRGSVASVFTRGAKPNFTLVLIDGVRVNDPTNTRGGSFDVSTLDLADIDHIEIVRGPSSAVYGSDAVGGVINIITKKGTDRFAGEADISVGEHGFWRYAGQVRGPIGDAAASLGVSRTDNGTPVAGSQFLGTALNGSLAANPFGVGALVLTGRYGSSDAASFPDSSGGPLLAAIRGLDRRQIQEGVIGASFDLRVCASWTQTLSYGLYDRTSRETSPGVASSAQDPSGIPMSADSVSFMRNEVTWTNRVKLDSETALILGLDALRENGTDNGTLFFGPVALPTRYALDRTIWSGFVEAQYQPSEYFQISVGARDDIPTHADAHFSPKLGLRSTLAATGTTAELSWASGFKLPSLYALGNPLVGDPHLRPEESRNLEAGITQELSVIPGQLKLSAYSTHYSNLIDFDPIAFRLVNLSAVRVRGGELELDLKPFDDLTLKPFVAYTFARDELTGASLRDVPRWQAGGTLQWQATDSVALELTVFHVGSLIDNSVPTGDVRLPAHQRIDLASTWALSKATKVYLSIENLLNARYQEAVGFPAEGFFLRGGITVAY